MDKKQSSEDYLEAILILEKRGEEIHAINIANF